MERGQKLGHVPALDGLRGVAIGSVLLFHGYGVTGGFLGVDLFFVLSGFLITTLLLEEHAANGRISFRTFYARRARRLLPVALLGIVVAELLMFAAAAGRLERQELSGLFAAVYVENLGHFLHPPVITVVGHYWSLSQEEQFYLLWPPLLYLLLRRRTNPRFLVAGLLTLAIAVAAHRASLADGWRLYGPDARSDGILIGCAVAVAWRCGWLRWRGFPLAGLAALVVYFADILFLREPMLYGVTVANVAATVMVASIVCAPQASLGRLLCLSPVRWLGLVSYSLYIWQPIVANVGQLSGTTMLVAALVVAFCSFRFVEQPLRHARSLERRHVPRERGARPSQAAA